MNAPEPVLSNAQMRAAEKRLIDQGVSVDELMSRAGKGAAEWIWRLAAGRDVTVLCGPGNNGGDGYVIAETLRRRGLKVRVVAPMPPTSSAARNAAEKYKGEHAEPGCGGVFVDCLFGTGLRAPITEELEQVLRKLLEQHGSSVAIDVPSGTHSDSGALLNDGLGLYDLTLALGAWKPAHWLMPSMAQMGERRLVSIGALEEAATASLSQRPVLPTPTPFDHKYTRGLVAVVGGAMPGAAVLASEAAQRAGAGYTKLFMCDDLPSVSADIVAVRGPLVQQLADDRIKAVLIGCGLGRDETARARLREAIASGHPLVLDADALVLPSRADVGALKQPTVLTPHAGELARLCTGFGIEAGDKVQQAQALAEVTGAVVLAKGYDTILTDGQRTRFFPPSSTWLSTAGTGDVLAGIVTSRLSQTNDPFRSAEEAVWLHGEAARLCRSPFTAGDLCRSITTAYGSFL